MKCPKCGSELLLSAEKGINKCTKCLMKEYKEVKHQARLDKVLSKFDEEGIYWLDDIYLYIQFDNFDEFRLCSDEHKNNVMTSIAISLDTVEHLIADLERGNE